MGRPNNTHLMMIALKTRTCGRRWCSLEGTPASMHRSRRGRSKESTRTFPPSSLHRATSALLIVLGPAGLAETVSLTPPPHPRPCLPLKHLSQCEMVGVGAGMGERQLPANRLSNGRTRSSNAESHGPAGGRLPGCTSPTARPRLIFRYVLVWQAAAAG